MGIGGAILKCIQYKFQEIKKNKGDNMKFNERIDEIYDSLKRSARGNWRYDTTTMTLVIYLDDKNIIKAKIPDRNIGAFIAESPNRVAWLMESIYVHKEIALQLIPKELHDKYTQFVEERLKPSEGEVEAQEESKGVNVLTKS